MTRFLLIASITFVLHACAQQTENRLANSTQERLSSGKSLLNPDGKILKERILPPEGCFRNDVEENSFASYLQQLPMKAHGASVLTYDGREKIANGVYCAVVDLPIGKRDLHQCADAVMRLRAEYLFEQKRYNEIHFNFTNGFRADYSKWRSGQRIAVNGNHVNWTSGGQAGDSYASFWSYLEKVFTYAGTLSLSKELKGIPLSELQPGDVFIQGGSPGHAVIVVDLAENEETGEKFMLLAQSYMPAQDIQVLNNPGDEAISPWYKLDFGDILHTPEWTFKASDLKRFE